MKNLREILGQKFSQKFFEVFQKKLQQFKQKFHYPFCLTEILVLSTISIFRTSSCGEFSYYSRDGTRNTVTNIKTMCFVFLTVDKREGRRRELNCNESFIFVTCGESLRPPNREYNMQRNETLIYLESWTRSHQSEKCLHAVLSVLMSPPILL